MTAYPGYQEPPTPRVVALTDVTDGWWPDLPRLCGTCDVRLYVDPPVDGERGRVFCGLCARESAEVVERPLYRPALTPGEIHPKRGRVPQPGRMPNSGRPPRPKPTGRPVSPTSTALPCADCGTRRVKPGNRLCQPCARDKARPAPLRSRFVALLLSSPGLPSHEIAAILGCTRGTVRQLVHAARLRGVPIINEGRRYRIGEEAA